MFSVDRNRDTQIKLLLFSDDSVALTIRYTPCYDTIINFQGIPTNFAIHLMRMYLCSYTIYGDTNNDLGYTTQFPS